MNIDKLFNDSLKKLNELKEIRKNRPLTEEELKDYKFHKEFIYYNSGKSERDYINDRINKEFPYLHSMYD
jgi:hypothetical protein